MLVQPSAGSGAGIEAGDPEPVHSKLYSVGVQASWHVTVSPAGVVMAPSACSTDPLGTWQTWNIELGVHPLPDPASNVLAAAGQSQAGMSISCLCATDEPQAARDAAANRPTTIAWMCFINRTYGSVRMGFLLRMCAAVKRPQPWGDSSSRGFAGPSVVPLQAQIPG